jgi:hypothetical protein
MAGSALPRERLVQAKQKLVNVDIARIDQEIARIDGRLQDLREDYAALREGQTHTQRLLTENTEITRAGLHAVVEQLEKHIKRTEPLAASYEAMQSGINTIGTIGKWGKRIGKVALYATASYFAFKVFLHGDGVQETINEFWRVISGVK